MKLLEKEELRGIDSTTKTIEKWDEFLKKAVWNMGYDKDVVDHMYPYERGIPLINGEYMPVDSKSGRRFFKMSWSDALAGILSIVCNDNVMPFNTIVTLKAIILKFAALNKSTFDKLFPDMPEETYTNLKNEISSSTNLQLLVRNTSDTSVGQQIWEKFIDDSDITTFAMHISEDISDNHGYLDTDEKEQIKQLNSPSRRTSGKVYFIFNKTLENEYSKFPREDMRQIFCELSNMGLLHSGNYSSLKAFDEVYCSEYLVISLNPVDKMMCSTKQAFGSCMSFAKQGDTRGTYSVHAFGLPALFPSDKVFLVFTTPGKHKNMYWETEEWEKEPESRDPDKAYKYLKMSCRALTYKGTLAAQQRSYLNILSNLTVPEEGDEETIKLATEVKQAAIDAAPNAERLFVGRQYSANGEDFRWQGLIEVLMARQGISTSMAYATALHSLFKHITKYPHTTLASILDMYDCAKVESECSSKQIEGRCDEYLRKGEIHGVDFACLDRYGLRRGIYFDNVTFNINTDLYQAMRSANTYYATGFEAPPGFKIAQDDIAYLHVGSSRSGFGSFSTLAPKSELDAFKIISGEQDYTYLNRNIKVCSLCGELLKAGEGSLLLHGQQICEHCREERGIKRCEACGELYLPEEASQHKLYNMTEIINPGRKDLDPIWLCATQLETVSVTGDPHMAICAHCGKLYRSYDSGALGKTFATKDIDGILVKFRLCDRCISHAALCDKCKRLIFLDSLTDACLLLPHRRIICPDCIDNIRAKKEVKDHYKEILSPDNIADTVAPDPAEDITIADMVARNIDEAGFNVGSTTTRIKDPAKQIVSYLQNHPEEGLPKLKPSNPPLVSVAAGDDEVVLIGDDNE